MKKNRQLIKKIVSFSFACAILVVLMPKFNFEAGATAEMLQEPILTEMNTNTEYHIVLDENPKLRWNVDGIGFQGADVHLNDSNGKNCFFKFYSVLDDENQPTEYYGIKHIVGGEDRFVDVEDKETKIGQTLNVWSKDDYSEDHRQFKFYYQGTNENGEMLYYIQNKKSGHWLGVNSSDDGIKIGNQISQVSEDDRKLWRITAGKGQGGESLATANKVHITLADDLSLRWNADNNGGFRDTIHLDDLNGSNCEFRLYPTGDGFYGIELPRKDPLIDYFVDVSEEDETVNRKLHLWSIGNFSETNQQFSFHPAGENDSTGRMMYYIQARHSGLWIGTKNNEKPDDKVDLAQVEKSDRLAFYVTNVDNTVEKDERSRYWYYIGLDEWMSHLRDDTKLNEINMPGTHDSGTKYVGFQHFGSNCQNRDIREQLDIGVRFLDIRLKKSGDRYILCHNFCDAYYHFSYITELEFEKHVLEEYVYQFLEENPTETIVMSIKEDDGNTDNASKDMGKALKEIIDKNSDLWYTENRIPELSEVRGKIVLASRIKNTVTGYEGLDFSDWQSEDLYTTTVAGHETHIQDEYCGGRITFNSNAKWNTYKSVLQMSEYNMFGEDDLVINYSSANNLAHKVSHGPRYYSTYLNPEITYYNFQYGVQYGWQIWDFPTPYMTANLISSNNYASNMIVDIERYYPGCKIDFKLQDLYKDNTGRKINFDIYSDEARENKIKSFTHTMTTDNLEGSVIFGDMEDELQLVPRNDYYISIYEVETTNAPASDELKYKFTYNTDLTGVVSISGDAVYGETLTATLTNTNNTGTLYYLWRGDGYRLAPLSTNNTYTLGETDIGKNISVEVFSDKEMTTLQSVSTKQVQKSDATKPSAPTLSGKSETSITLNTVAGQEYKLGNGDWQESGEFIGLIANTDYSLYTRIKETSTHKNSSASEALSVTTSVAHKVTATAGENGTISSNVVDEVVEYNESITFTFTPDSGYQIDKVTVDNVEVTVTGGTYTIENVTANMEINAMFKNITHTITATAGDNGTISPSGDITVNDGNFKTLTFTPDTGYAVDKVTINDVEVTLYEDEYTLPEITDDMEINVTFKNITHTITATAGDNGTISPSGDITVNEGDDKEFTFTANSGYQIDKVTVDNVEVTVSENAYTITNVTADTRINVTFVEIENPSLPKVEGDNQKTTFNSGNDVTFKIDADFSEFNRLEYNGTTVDTANYTAESGSIIITLKGEYVKTLPVGTHVFKAVVGNNQVPLNLIVESSQIVTPPTGDSSSQDDTTNPDTSGDTSDIFISILALILCIAVAFKKKLVK